MTELFEDQLSERLHARPLPAEVPGLGMRSMRLGQRMRRRRIGAVVAVLIVLVTIPGAAGWLSGPNADRPPVTNSPTASASVAPNNGIPWGPDVTYYLHGGRLFADTQPWPGLDIVQ